MQREAHAEWPRLVKGQERLGTFMAGMKGEQRQALEAKKKLLDTAVAKAARELGEIEADAEALENPGTKREEYVAILARAKSRSGVIARTEVDLDAIWTPDWTKPGGLRKTLGDLEATWEDGRPNVTELERKAEKARRTGCAASRPFSRRRVRTGSTRQPSRRSA